MKARWKKLPGSDSTRNKKGFAFIMVLVFLLVGTMLITPLLTFMASGLTIGTTYRRNMDELYAADAGMAQAILYLKHNGRLQSVPNVTGDSSSYNLASDINGKTVSFNITCVSAGGLTQSFYKITSVANSSSTSKTNIEAYVRTLPFIWDNAVTTNGTIDANGATIIGPQVYIPDTQWPFTTSVNLSDFYWTQPGVSTTSLNVTPPPPNTLSIENLSTPRAIGPGSRVNNPFILRNNGGAGLNITQNGTIYIKNGDLTIGKTQQGFTYFLNGQTIFSEGSIEIGDKTTINGSGCIIAIGDITFKPNLQSSPNDFIFIMSLTGQVYFAPNGNFYGSVAGHDKVQFQPGNYFMLPAEPPPNLNFPMDDINRLAVRIRTWKITRN